MAAKLQIFRGARDGRTLFIRELTVGKSKVGYFPTWPSDYGKAAADKARFRSIYRTFRPTR